MRDEASSSNSQSFSSSARPARCERARISVGCSRRERLLGQLADQQQRIVAEARLGDQVEVRARHRSGRRRAAVQRHGEIHRRRTDRDQRCRTRRRRSQRSPARAGRADASCRGNTARTPRQHHDADIEPHRPPDVELRRIEPAASRKPMMSMARRSRGSAPPPRIEPMQLRGGRIDELRIQHHQRARRTPG